MDVLIINRAVVLMRKQERERESFNCAFTLCAVLSNEVLKNMQYLLRPAEEDLDVGQVKVKDTRAPW
jgi:hypothetical protein